MRYFSFAKQLSVLLFTGAALAADAATDKLMSPYHSISSPQAVQVAGLMRKAAIIQAKQGEFETADEYTKRIAANAVFAPLTLRFRGYILEKEREVYIDKRETILGGCAKYNKETEILSIAADGCMSNYIKGYDLMLNDGLLSKQDLPILFVGAELNSKETSGYNAFGAGFAMTQRHSKYIGLVMVDGDLAAEIIEARYFSDLAWQRGKKAPANPQLEASILLPREVARQVLPRLVLTVKVQPLFVPEIGKMVLKRFKVFPATIDSGLESTDDWRLLTARLISIDLTDPATGIEYFHLGEHTARTIN